MPKAKRSTGGQLREVVTRYSKLRLQHTRRHWKAPSIHSNFHVELWNKFGPEMNQNQGEREARNQSADQKTDPRTTSPRTKSVRGPTEVVRGPDAAGPSRSAD